MKLDLLATDNLGQYNVSVARKLGLKAAVYINEIVNINRKAVMKSAFTTKGFLKLDRGYVTKRTTLTTAEQRELDDALSKLCITEVNTENKDEIKLDLDALTGVLLEDNKKINDTVKQLATPKRNKRDDILNAVKLHIITDDCDLRKAYDAWLEAVMQKKGWLATSTAEYGQKAIDGYSKGNKDIAMKLLEIATISGYQNIDWAINQYERSRNIAIQNNKI